MYQGWRIIVLTPYGRRRYVSLLAKHIERARPLVDEWHLWMNACDPEDAQWGEQLVASDHDFYRAVYSDDPPSTNQFRRLRSFYEHYRSEPDTIYVRLDDDVVWLAPDAIEQLVHFRLENPDYFVIFANTVNNGLCSHLHQRMGLLAPGPFIEYAVKGPVSWCRWETAADAHDALLNAIAHGNWSKFQFERWALLVAEHCSINCITWWGRDWNAINELLPADEEIGLSCELPKLLGRPNCIAGRALVSHFAFYTQRSELERQRPDLLQKYALLARGQHARELEFAFEHGRQKAGCAP